MSDCNKFTKGNTSKEVVGRNANFVLLVILEKLECCDANRFDDIKCFPFVPYIQVLSSEAQFVSLNNVNVRDLSKYVRGNYKLILCTKCKENMLLLFITIKINQNIQCCEFHIHSFYSVITVHNLCAVFCGIVIYIGVYGFRVLISGHDQQRH